MNFTNKYISSEYIFSDWIFLWFIIYISPFNTNKILLNKYLNPVYSLYFALFINIVMFMILLIQHSKYNIIIKMLLLMLCEKIVPIYILHQVYNYNNDSLHFLNNIPFMVGIFIIYIIYLDLQDATVYQVYDGIFYSIKNDDNNTPFFSLFHKLFGL